MKQAYLTIDDGPSVDRKAKVDVLNRHQIQAVWFCMGVDMEARPEDALYTIEAGHIVGNHSFSHPDFSVISLEQARDEIISTDQMIEDLYQKAGVPRPVKLFRFPYGKEGAAKPFFNFDYTPEEFERVTEIQKVLKDLGYVTFPFEEIRYRYFQGLRDSGRVDWLWTYDAMEWCVFQEKPPFGVKCLDDVLEMMDLDLPERFMGLNYPDSEEIVVIHDHPQTSALFEPVVRGLLDKGVRFKRFS